MASAVKRLRRAAETVAFSGFVGAVRALPYRRARALGAGAGRFAFDRGLRRRVAEENVRARLAVEDPEEARRIARESYAVMGRTFAGLLRGDRVPEPETDRLLSPGQADTFRNLHAEGKGVVLVSGHFGDWELMLLAAARLGLPMAALAGDQANPSVDAAVRRLRREAGITPLSARSGLRDALRFLRRGGLVATLGDQDARRKGIFLDFLGTPASTHTGVFSLALRAGSPVLFGVCVDRDGRPETRPLRIWRPDDAPTGEADALRHGAAWYNRALEEEVRDAPGNYFWAHRRWKTRPPAEDRP